MSDAVVPPMTADVDDGDSDRRGEAQQRIQGTGRQGQAPAEKPSFVQLLMKLAMLYAVFSILTILMGQFRSSPVSDTAEAVMKSKGGDDSIVLNRLPEEQPQVAWMKDAMGIQSSQIPQFPTYDAYGRQLKVHRCTFPKGQKMDLNVYLSDSQEDPPLWLEEGDEGAPKLLWTEKDLVFAADPADVTRHATVDLEVPPHLLRNGSVWAHVYLSKTHSSHNPKSPLYDDGGVAHHKAQLNKFLPKSKEKREHYLIAAGTRQEQTNVMEGFNAMVEVEESGMPEIVNYWKPTLNLGLVDYMVTLQRNRIPPAFNGHITFQESTGNYHPMVYVNEFWLQQKHLILMNESVQTVPLALSISPISLWKFQMMAQLEAQWAAQSKMGLSGEGETDTFRQLLAETNPIILVITALVSLLHTIFNFLAFKNEISFWRNKKQSHEGISVQGMLVNLFFQAVIFLYLLDNNTTSMVVVTTAIGLAIEVWKVGKFMVGRLDWAGPDGQPGHRIPRLVILNTEAYRTSKTKEFDDVATRHLMHIVAPLMLGYAGYSMIHHQHKGWYSWVLNSLVGFVYMFGFVMMTPQLFINYKLKSIAHMPWRVMTYKFINTFIDDLFAFIVPMPTLHRIACFRDDAIFFVFLYQRYLYPVDKRRQNEFGQSPGGAEDDVKIDEDRNDTRRKADRTLHPSEIDKLR